MHDQPARKHGDIDELLRICLEQSLQAVQATGVATETELARTRVAFERAVAKGEPMDVLEILARMQGAEEEHLGIEVARISHAVSMVIHPSPPLIPFAAKLIALARALLAPVIFAEDTDAVGTGALNPVAARIMADEILSTVDRRFGIKPFVTSVRMDYESWSFITRKHFGL